MVENCYILYSCDGTYPPIISNFSGLSESSFNYVSIDISGQTPDTCFFVVDLGIVECDITYEITINTGITCDCNCYCYFIKSTDQTTDITYVDCNDDIVVETITQGLTYNICSKIYPQFDDQIQIPLKLTDICEDNQCPTSIPSVKPKNECDVITIFPMGVSCFTQQPSSDRTFDGAVELVVTGGTPPYTIFWEIGSFAPALTNLGVGDYSATITDYYGDFSAITTCSLTAETTNFSGMCFVLTGVVENELVYINSQPEGFKNTKPYFIIQYGVELLGYVFWDQSDNMWVFCSTLECQGEPYNILNENDYLYPTGSTGNWVFNSDTQYLITQSTLGNCEEPTIPIDLTSLCATLTIRSSKTDSPVELIQIELDPSNTINGEPSWSSSTGQYVVYWNTGSTPPQWVFTGYSNSVINIVNNDPTYPPLSNWQIYGPPEVLSLQMTQGECLDSYEIVVSTVVNDAECNTNGSITVSANGGQMPYQYSINGGLTYQSSPIFGSLSPGNYDIFVLDSNNVTGSLTNIVVGNVPITNYVINFNINYNNNTFVLTAPSLPIGVTITLDVVMNSTFNYYPQNLIPIPTYNNFTNIQGVGNMTLVNTLVNVYVLGGPCSITGPINNTQIVKQFVNTITMTSGQVISGSTTTNIINQPIELCELASGYYSLTLSNVVLNNCSCCNPKTIITSPPTPQPSS